MVDGVFRVNNLRRNLSVNQQVRNVYMPPIILETPFGFNIDLSFWQNFFGMPAFQQAKGFFIFIVWWAMALILFNIGAKKWAAYRQKKQTSTWQWSVLAVDVPILFVQSPKAVEQIFVNLSGAYVEANLLDKYWTGKAPKWFSFEIISIEGYIQFVVRTEEEFRDLVEAAIYAQYPEAEITEVEDYVNTVPDVFPNETHEMAGVEFSLIQHEAYPIRTYPHFEYKISKDVVFSDPMAAILENFSRIASGENFWLQLVVRPADNSWKKKGIDLVKKIIANKKEQNNSVMTFVSGLPGAALRTVLQIWHWDFEMEEKEETRGKISDLTPGMKSVVESIEEKISKLGFHSRLRVLYVAKKEVFNPRKCLAGLVGSLNQFYIADRNGLVAKKVGGSDFVSAFKQRKLKLTNDPYILNIEELATLWHFPLPDVKTPLVQKSSAKRGEAPNNLPVVSLDDVQVPDEGKNSEETEATAPREELPYA